MGKILQYSGISLALLVLATGIALISSDLFLKTVVQPISNSNPVVGQILSTEGQVLTRPAGDILWLPTNGLEEVKAFDKYFINNDSEISIQLEKTKNFKGAKIYAEGLALIQIYKIKEVPALKIQMGQVEIVAEEETKIHIDLGFKVEVVTLSNTILLLEKRKTGLSIKNKPPKARNYQLPGSSKNNKERKKNKSPKTFPTEISLENSEEDKKAYRYVDAYPPANSKVFYQKSKEMKVTPTADEICPAETCQLTVRSEDKILCQKNFSFNELAFCIISIDQFSGSVEVQWQGKKEKNYNFTAQPMTEENMLLLLNSDPADEVILLF